MSVYDLHDEMNPARLIGPEPAAVPAGRESDEAGGADPAAERLARLEADIDHELDPMLWRDVCDPLTPPAPVATGLEAVGLAVHGMEPGPLDQTGQIDQVALAEAPTADLAGPSRLRAVVGLLGVLVALLLLTVIVVFVR